MQILDDAGDSSVPSTEGTVYFAPPTGRRFHYRGDTDKTEHAHHAATPSPSATSAGSTTTASSSSVAGWPTSSCRRASTSTPPRSSRRCPTSPGIADLCAVGGPDAERGEVVVLYLASAAGADREQAILAITATAAERLAPYKRPRSVTVVDDIPRDQTGKLLRRVLRDPLWAAGLTIRRQPAGRRQGPASLPNRDGVTDRGECSWGRRAHQIEPRLCVRRNRENRHAR